MSEKETPVISRESHLRSILKGITWRFIATGTTMTITYIATGSLDSALTVGGADFVFKFLLYYGHERLWQMAPVGSVRKIVGKD